MKFKKGFSEWYKGSEKAEWPMKVSELWQDIEKYMVRGVNVISEPEPQEIVGCGIRFNQQHLQSVCDAIKYNNYLNITTNTNIRNLQKLETYQALNILGYTNFLFIGLKVLMNQRKEIHKLWPCKWSAVLVIDCDCEDNLTDILLNILRETADSAQSSECCNDNEVEPLVGILQKYQQKVILISKEHRKFAASFKDNCDMSHLDEMSQNKILEKMLIFKVQMYPCRHW
jgi:hypothetical protein